VAVALAAAYLLSSAAMLTVAVLEHRRADRLDAARRELWSRIDHCAPQWRREDTEFPGCRW
jgi:hypothetical protein